MTVDTRFLRWLGWRCFKLARRLRYADGECGLRWRLEELADWLTWKAVMRDWRRLNEMH